MNNKKLNKELEDYHNAVRQIIYSNDKRILDLDIVLWTFIISWTIFWIFAKEYNFILLAWIIGIGQEILSLMTRDKYLTERYLS